MKYVEYAFKIIQVVGFVLVVGALVEKWNSSAAVAASLESRMTAVEEQQYETVSALKQTVGVVSQLEERLRSHEIEDAATTERVNVISRQLEMVK